jgi:hypothetical protein
MAVLASWILVWDIARWTSPAHDDNWTVFQHASWLVTVGAVPVAVAGLLSLVRSLVGPKVEVGLAKVEHGGTVLVRDDDATGRQLVRLRIGVTSSRFAREMTLVAEFDSELLTDRLVSANIGTVGTNTKGRVQWDADVKNVHPRLTRVCPRYCSKSLRRHWKTSRLS